MDRMATAGAVEPFNKIFKLHRCTQTDSYVSLEDVFFMDEKGSV